MKLVWFCATYRKPYPCFNSLHCLCKLFFFPIVRFSWKHLNQGGHNLFKKLTKSKKCVCTFPRKPFGKNTTEPYTLLGASRQNLHLTFLNYQSPVVITKKVILHVTKTKSNKYIWQNRQKQYTIFIQAKNWVYQSACTREKSNKIVWNAMN